MPKTSRRTAELGTENAFVVLAEVNELIRQGKSIISFCIGQPDFHTPVNIQDAAVKAIREGRHGYTPSAGIPELRAAAAKDMGRLRGLSIDPEHVVIGAGAKPFIAYTILCTTDYGVGDEVIYPNPGFPIYESQILACGAVPVPLYLREARDFAFDPAELEARITPKTKLLILNSPHNPTGGILTKKDLEDIAQVLRRHPEVWIFADEIYSRLLYQGEFASIASLPGMYERTIISDGASKTWAMTGWRIGFTSNPILAPQFVRWVTNTDSCASHISQWAAVGGYQRPAGRTAQNARQFSRPARPDRGPAEPGAGRELQAARRRVLRLAQCHRGLPHDRRQGLGRAAPTPVERSRGGGARGHPFRRACPARGSTSVSPTPRPIRRSRTASRAWRTSSATTAAELPWARDQASR